MPGALPDGMPRLVPIALVTGATLASAPARAQVCHGMATDDAPPEIAVHAGLDTAAASISMGSYAEVAPSAEVAWRRLDVRVVTPFYHLEYRGVRSDGIGDVLASVSAAAIDGRRARAGVALAFTRPTGLEAVGLGTGAPMYMPGAWASFDGATWSLFASAAYGWMAMDMPDSGMHHSALPYVGSLVSPMNDREVEGALRATYHASDELHLYAAGSVAAPIGDGVTRAFAVTGARLERGHTAFTLEAALPLAGDPFHGRMSLGVVRAF
jgi:hypothetical protein